MGPNDLVIGNPQKSQPEEINESILSCEEDEFGNRNEDEFSQTN